MLTYSYPHIINESISVEQRAHTSIKFVWKFSKHEDYILASVLVLMGTYTPGYQLLLYKVCDTSPSGMLNSLS